jgi:hypothetical protein
MTGIKNVIIRHCNPVLLGCKPAALFTLASDSQKPLSDYARPGIDCLILREQEGGLLVFLFDKAPLEKTVLADPVRGALVKMGYPSRSNSDFKITTDGHGQTRMN